MEVTKSDDPGPTAFHIFWIVPSQSYTFQIDLNQDGDADCTEFIEDVDLAEGELFTLNNGDDIESGVGNCN